MGAATAAQDDSTDTGAFGDTLMSRNLQRGRDVTASLDDSTELPIASMVRMIGGATVLIAIIVVVVNAVLTTDVVANTTGPFDSVITDLETTGVAAMGLLIVGLLVAAGMWIMSIMDMGGGGF